MKPSLLCAFLAAALLPCQAGEYLRTKSGQVFVNFTVVRYGPDYIVLRQGTIPMKVKLDDLEPADRAKAEPYCRQVQQEAEQLLKAWLAEEAKAEGILIASKKRETGLARELHKPVPIDCYNGESYRLTAVLECEAEHLRFIYDQAQGQEKSGTGRVLYAELPEDWQTLLRYKLVGAPGLEQLQASKPKP